MIRFSATAAATLIVIWAAVGMADTTVGAVFAKLFHDNAWVTAYAGARDHTPGSAATDAIVVRRGASERTIYTASANDLGLGEPVVSRDGTVVAFRKEQREGGHVTEGIFAVPLHGGGPQTVAALEPRGIPIKGARLDTAIAWSHDNRKILLNHNLAGQEPRRDHSDTLSLVDTESGATREVVSAHPRRPGSPLITPQAWAPDGRRFVYTDAEGLVTVFDTVTASSESLGPGEHATWSGDGAMIAAMVVQGRKGYDYVVISIATKQRRTVLESRRGLFRSGVFFGEPLWTPDGRFLVIPKLRGEDARTHVVDWRRGDVDAVPFRFRGTSIGGRG